MSKDAFTALRLFLHLLFGAGVWVRFGFSLRFPFESLDFPICFSVSTRFAAHRIRVFAFSAQSLFFGCLHVFLRCSLFFFVSRSILAISCVDSCLRARISRFC